MNHHFPLQFAAKSDTGLMRPHNEDSIAVNLSYGLMILADGMGGYNAGEVASLMAITTIKETLEKKLTEFDEETCEDSASLMQHMLIEAIESANGSILTAALNSAEYNGMGTTVVTTLFHHDKIFVAHVGDSRLYRLRQQELMVLTRDHSLIQEQIDAGLIDQENARFAPNRNLITRAVGIDPLIDVEVHEYETQVGDLYLLCSDGLTDMLSTEEIFEILSQPNNELEGCCDTLIHRANDNGGHDNTSVILVKVEPINSPQEGFFGRILSWMK